MLDERPPVAHIGAVHNGTVRSAEPPYRRTEKRRIAITSMIGTMIEFYDFIIYGVASALVFPRLFFPDLGAAAGTLASFATFGVAFAARPVGGALFGHFGDRLGRKTTLITSLMVMGGSTVVIGLLPTAAQIGLAAPILLVILRMFQGLAAGGEWAGATLFVTEHAPAGKRGFWTVFPQVGATSATAIGNTVFLATGFSISDEAFASYGWRIPFLASALLVVTGLYFRLKIEETPVFRAEAARGGPARIPIVEAFRSQPREILVAAGVGLGTTCFFYVSGTYLTTYATGTLHLSRSVVLAAGAIGGVVLSVAVVTTALLSDRWGRRRTIAAASIAGAIWAVFLVPVLDVGTPGIYILALIVTMACSGAVFGPQGAFFAELFRTRYRFTASAISYNLGNLVGGSITPLLATALSARFGPMAFGLLLAGLCGVGAVCTFSLRETRGSQLDAAAADQ
ncbi:MHS family MFS transporter [Nocardia sp. CA2R105]|uniref:MFS transporter n=1 Tax=Nocardia coffeae TaxID=2873381 RepID=UPI001CA75B4C|nr:MFS transporter [Nocardia coffeae]MBY8858693.1 MHS family MFS transporter [Nocardia coffeae]